MRFLRGRLKFVRAKSGPPFPSMIVVFRGQRMTLDVASRAEGRSAAALHE